MRLGHRVVVYGTLRRAGTNHGCLVGARFLGGYRTEPDFTLLDVGAWPGLVSGGDTAIVTEVYGVTPAMLARLDRLEDCPRRYRRVTLDTPWGLAWLYLYRPPCRGHKRIASGDWIAYRHRRLSTRPLPRWL
jgi:gamma-glutamylaminecyclotransferase